MQQAYWKTNATPRSEWNNYLLHLLADFIAQEMIDQVFLASGVQQVSGSIESAGEHIHATSCTA
jgi:hypothetical protein